MKNTIDRARGYPEREIDVRPTVTATDRKRSNLRRSHHTAVLLGEPQNALPHRVALLDAEHPEMMHDPRASFRPPRRVVLLRPARESRCSISFG